MKSQNKKVKVPATLSAFKEQVLDLCSLTLKNLQIEKESLEYDACTFRINKSVFYFRNAKITPTKTGQFVTLWKRNTKGIIEPFSHSDDLGFAIINVTDHKDIGMFVFPKSVLMKRGILTTPSKEGKRGFRVYPPWNLTTSKQAINSQAWQLEYFVTYKPSKSLDIDRIKQLIKCP